MFKQYRYIYSSLLIQKFANPEGPSEVSEPAPKVEKPSLPSDTREAAEIVGNHAKNTNREVSDAVEQEEARGLVPTEGDSTSSKKGEKLSAKMPATPAQPGEDMPETAAAGEDVVEEKESPEGQKTALLDNKIEEFNNDLNPEEAEKFTEFLEGLREDEAFQNMTPEEAEAYIAQEIARMEGELAGSIAVEAKRHSEIIHSPVSTPAQREVSRTAMANIESSYSWMRGNSSWQSLAEGDFQSSKYRSEPVERSESGTTLCSRTAFKNLTKMGMENVHRGSSAKESFEMYGGGADTSFPNGQSDKKFADVYLDASPKNAQYGHRAAAFNEGGNWFILDPYYAIPGHPDREGPIPAEKYLNHMCGTKGRKFWGAHYLGEGGNGGAGAESMPVS